MGLVLLSLAVGVVIGFIWRNSPGKVKKANLLTLAGLFFLLLVMGAQLGSNREVLSGLGRIGKQAFIIAGLSIVGSVIMVQLASGYIQKNLTVSQNDGVCKVGDKH